MLQEIENILHNKKEEIEKKIRLKKYKKYFVSSKFFEEETFFSELVRFLKKDVSKFFISNYNIELEEIFKKAKSKNGKENIIYGRASKKTIELLEDIKKLSQDSRGTYYFPWIYFFTKEGICILSYEDGGNKFEVLMTPAQFAEFKKILKAKKLEKFIKGIEPEQIVQKRK